MITSVHSGDLNPPRTETPRYRTPRALSPPLSCVYACADGVEADVQVDGFRLARRGPENRQNGKGNSGTHDPNKQISKQTTQQATTRQLTNHPTNTPPTYIHTHMHTRNSHAYSILTLALRTFLSVSSSPFTPPSTLTLPSPWPRTRGQ